MRVQASRRSPLDLTAMCTCYLLLTWLTCVSYRLRLLLGCVVALTLRRLRGTRLLAGLDLRSSETDCGEDQEGVIVSARLKGGIRLGQDSKRGLVLVL